ncbi:MAG: hypothetical protein IJV71_00990 [Lachnospiraceae bacterium]|nr:hypothetical protein [Lachnospiraceae bacterium]
MFYNFLCFIGDKLATPVVDGLKKAMVHKSNGDIGRAVVAIATSLLYLISMIFVLALGILFLLKFHIEIIIIIGAISWLYALVYKKYLKNDINSTPSSNNGNEADTNILIQNAINGYAPIRTVFIKVFKSCAPYLGCIPPKYLSDIEDSSNKYIIDFGCVWYNFCLKKENIKIMYTDDELKEFSKIIQSAFKRLWEAGQFNHIELKAVVDEGTILDPILITKVEDYGDILQIQVTYTTPRYVELMREYNNFRDTQNQYIEDSQNDPRFL